MYGENESGAASTIVSIRINKGQYLEEGVFPTMDADVVAIYACSMKGNFVGTQKRECVLGEREGEWQKARGVCVSVVLIILLCVVVFVVFWCEEDRPKRSRSSPRRIPRVPRSRIILLFVCDSMDEEEPSHSFPF